MDLVCGVGIPDDELSILRGGNEMATVGGPVHGVNLGEVTFKRASGLHSNSWQGIGVVLRDLADWTGTYESVRGFKVFQGDPFKGQRPL